MGDIEKIAEFATTITTDTQAKEESKDLVSRYTRQRREQNALHWAFISVLWIIVVGFIISVAIKICHLILPMHDCWLTDVQITKLNDFITTGGIGGIGGALLKNKFPSTDK